MSLNKQIYRAQNILQLSTSTIIDAGARSRVYPCRCRDLDRLPFLIRSIDPMFGTVLYMNAQLL